jgi:SNF2 family DNA or RNA helicase
MQFKIQPWKHQLEAFERAKDRPEYGLFFEVGAGKTAAAILIARYKFELHNSLLRSIVFCPPIVVENWKREWPMHSNIDEKNIIPLRGSQKERVKTFIANSGKPCIFITNYESLLMKELFDLMCAWRPELLIFDELHKLKSIQSKRTKQAVKLADLSVYRLGLTGTSVLNSPMDLWSQYRVLDGGKTFGKNFFTFRNHYFYDKNAGMPTTKYFPDWKPKNSTFEEMNRLVKDTSMVVYKKDCLDLPPLVKTTVYCDMLPAQAKAYAEMKKAFITFLQDKAAVADLAITKALRLQQIVSGFVNLDGGEVYRWKEHPRREALKELLTELTPDHKVIVWAVFKENYNDIREVCTELGIRFVEVHGEISNKLKFENVDAFNNDISVRVLFGHPGSGGIGINLVPSDISIFYSRNFSLEQDIQAEARNYRGGSEVHKKVTRIDLVTPGTIDEQVVEKLAAKVAIGDKILRGWF